MPCYAEFGIINNFDKEKDYSDYEPKMYNCVGIDDNALNSWWVRLESMKSYFHAYSRPEMALARCGVTLIPPDSLDLFYDIVKNDTPSEFTEQVADVLAIISKAKHNSKYIIHYGT